MDRYRNPWRLGVIVLVAMIVAACAPAATPAPTPVVTPAPTPVVTPEPTPAAVACDPAEIVMVGQVRDKANPYYVAWLAGGADFAESVGLEQMELTYGVDSHLQQSQIRTLLAAAARPECVVLNILPNADVDTPVLVRSARDAGAMIVTQWNKPADLKPWDNFPTWLTHITYNDEASGYEIAKALFESMGGEGSIVALQGVLGATAADARERGLDRALAEFPNITVLDRQTADFDRSRALIVMNTLLAKHGDAIQGVWAANDDMGIGAVEALRAVGRAGAVKVVGVDAIPEAVQAVKDGYFAATSLANAYWQGGIGLAFGYCALTGQLDPATLTNDQRAWFAKSAIVTPENVDQFLAPPDAARYVAEEWACDTLFKNFLEPLP